MTDARSIDTLLRTIRRRTLVVAGLALLLGIGIDVSVSTIRELEPRGAIGWPLMAVGYAAGIMLTFSRGPLDRLAREPLVGLALDRMRAVRRAIQGDAVADRSLSPEERVRAVQLARAAPEVSIVQQAASLLILAGVLGLEITIDPTPAFLSWLMPLLALGVGIVCAVSTGLMIVRVRRARAFAAKEAPALADLRV